MIRFFLWTTVYLTHWKKILSTKTVFLYLKSDIPADFIIFIDKGTYLTYIA